MWDYQEYELVSRLLDQMVAAEPNRRLGSGTEVVRAVDELKRQIESGGHALDLTLKHKCSFCMAGLYKVLVAPQGPASRESMTWLAKLFGIHGNTPTPILLVCENCGHLQCFRPDLTGGPDRWRWE